MLDAFYSGGGYWGGSVAFDGPQSLHARNQCRHRVARVLAGFQRTEGLRVLDVGAGQGWTADWLAALAPQGLKRFDFVEPDDACSAAIERRKPCGTIARLQSLGQASPGYDVIFLNHVLEHVADPVDCVRSIVALLAEGARAYIEVPHADYRFKADVFPHTWFFTPAALQNLAARAGVLESQREAFGRLPLRSGMDLVWRAGFRACAALGETAFGAWLDDRIWSYEMRNDGVWLRWIIARPASRPE